MVFSDKPTKNVVSLYCIRHFVDVPRVIITIVPYDMKKLVPALVVVLCAISLLFTQSSFAQDQQSVGVPTSRPQATQTQNAIFIELGGNAVLYSLNYDRLLGQDYGFRVGFGYLGVSSGSQNNDGTSASASLLIIPATLNYFLASHSDGKVGSSKFELGAGIVLVDLSANVSGGGIGNAFSKSGFGGTATIGYRYQPYDGGVLFRIAFTPVFGSVGFLPWAGISFGFTF